MSVNISRLFRAFLLLSALILIYSQGSGAALGQTRILTEYFLEQDNAEVPFEYVQHQIIVHGSTDAKKDMVFLFDTGATATVIDPTLIDKRFHIADSLVQEAEGSSKAEVILVQDLFAGEVGKGAHSHNIAVLLSDLSQVSKLLEHKIDGIIGLNFMAGYVVEIDYVSHVLKFKLASRYTLGGKRPDNQSTFLFSIAQGNPKAPLSNLIITGKLAGGYDYEFILDSGFGGYVSIAKLAAEQSGLINNNTPRIAGSNFSVSHQFRSDKIRASFMMLGDINLSGRVIQVDTRNKDEFGQRGIIGNRFLQNYRVVLDISRRRLWLERVTTKEELDEAAKQILGINVRTDGNLIRVIRVARYSPAEKAGLQVGDVLLSMNGQVFADMGSAKAVVLLSSPEGKVSLELIHNPDARAGGGEKDIIDIVPTSPLDWKAKR